MKTTISIILLIMPIFLLGQIQEENCISCIENRVYTQLGASALGTQNISTGTNSFAVGYLNEATGNYSVAMPFFAKSIGERSLALGYYATANGPGSIALGPYSQTGANAMLSVAIGSLVSTSANYAMVIGFGLDDSPLDNSIEKSLMVGFDSDIPSLFIGPAEEAEIPGKVGIGTSRVE